MNVFACDPHPADSARALADRHVVKMVLETAQILSTVARTAVGDEHADAVGLYRATHKHHPCTVAAATDEDYLLWVFHHGLHLGREFLARFRKTHKSAQVVWDAGAVLGLSPMVWRYPARFPLAMPEEFQREDPHESYRLYLASKYAAWGTQARWTRAERPSWA